jgi:hypothetical protein
MELGPGAIWASLRDLLADDGHEIELEPYADAIERLGHDLSDEARDTAEWLEHAYDREARIVALDIPEREAILRVLEGRHRGDARIADDACPGACLAAARGSLAQPPSSYLREQP